MWRGMTPASRFGPGEPWRGALWLASLACVLGASCSADVTMPVSTTSIATITIDGGSRALERGTVLTLTAQARDSSGKVVVTPFAWRSTVDSVASVGRDGVLTALDTGVTIIVASALGVTSQPVGIRVVWQGAANAAAFQFIQPNAVSPGAKVADSLRVLVTNLAGGPAVGAKVAFAVTAGGGTVSPATATVGQRGTAATTWLLGPNVGKNSITASVIGADSTAVPWVHGNPVVFTINAYAALAVIQGDSQSGTVLSPLPVTPAVRLIDSAGKPRPGIPVTFTPTGNGRVPSAVASTNVNGVASAGVWTLGDAQGDQQLYATVESAKLVLHATATGTTVRFAATKVVAGQFATCATTSDQFVSCFGQAPQVGTGDTLSKSTPTLTKGGVHFTTLAAGGAHFCGTAADLSIYCWGVNSLVDTTGSTVTTLAPARLSSNVAWLQVSPGSQHNCGLANDQTAYCWGNNDSGQLGDNQPPGNQFVPQAVVGGFKFALLTGGAAHECGIAVDASALCWGLNSAGQLGDGTLVNRRTPTAVDSTLKWKSLGAGQSWTCGLSDHSAAYCWGGSTGRQTPVPYPTAPQFASLSVGAAHACALTSDGTAYCWGDNSSGQLGDSTTTSRDAPTKVATTMRFTSVSAGLEHTCGITVDGFVACWGRNQYGELGFSTPMVQLTARYVVLGVTP